MPIPLVILYGVFLTLVGACVGSFLNVLIWRLPYRGHEIQYQGKRGRLTLSWPPSHCPMCDAPIHWYQNIPVLSYFLLRGRCASCKAPFAIRYPLVELATALLWGGLYVSYFVAGWQSRVYPWQPAGFQGILDLRSDFGPFIEHALFASALLAASAIDADLFVIPLAIPWFLAIMGILAAGFLGPPLLPKSFAIIPFLDTGSSLAKLVLGTAAGLVLVNILMALKVMPRSFASASDMDAGTGPPSLTSETPAGQKSAPIPPATEDAPLAPPPILTNFKPAVAVVILLLAITGCLWIWSSPKSASLATVAVGIIIFLLGVLPRDAGQIDVTDEVVAEISSPHVRREIFKEILFLAVPLACAAIAHFIPGTFPPWPWLGRVLGSIFGLLVGGGVVWLIRIGGSLAFKKEAMGMGDAHLMAGVGAVIGAPLVLVAFFTAPFLGILWAIVLKIAGKPNVLPYGPWLSVASILILLLGNPAICAYLVLMGASC